MHAMTLTRLNAPLEWSERPDPTPSRNQVRVRVLACGVCRTDLHVVDGELPDPVVPIIPGHEIVGRIVEVGTDEELAPLLCAGLIGWRSLGMTGPPAQSKRLGLYGLGAAAHIIAQVAQWQGRSVYAFTRPGDETTQLFARGLGALWAGGSNEPSPEPLDAHDPANHDPAAGDRSAS